MNAIRRASIRTRIRLCWPSNRRSIAPKAIARRCKKPMKRRKRPIRKQALNGPPSPRRKTSWQRRKMPAPQPWLPLHAMELRYLATPQSLRAGEAASVDVELVADGAAASQLPELRLPPLDGAQVFPEPPQVDEAFERGRPRTRVTRRFAIVPAQAGPLRVPGLRLSWWDVRAGVARTTAPPPLSRENFPQVGLFRVSS